MRIVSFRLPILFSIFGVLVLQACNSPFQPQQVFSPELVVYGIAFRGDSTLVVRIETNSETPVNDTSNSEQIAGLSGSLVNGTSGETTALAAEYVNGRNFLTSRAVLASGTNLNLTVHAPGYLTCTSSVTVLDSGIIYPSYYTTSVMRDPASGGQPDPQFTIYPSALTSAIRLTMVLDYSGTGPDNTPVSGEIEVNPSYQKDTTSSFLRINGAVTQVQFKLSAYTSAYSQALGKITSGTVTAVLRLVQIDATLYDFYSIANGFNDPLTMQTEKPVYTNVKNGLGFFGSAADDSLTIQVYP